MCAWIVCSWTVLLVLLTRPGGTWSSGPVYVPPHAESLTAAATVLAQTSLPTVTVRGFLNFRTTVDGTVIVFTPASDAPQQEAQKTSSQQPPSRPQLQTTNVLGFEIVGGEPANEVLPSTETTLSKTSAPEPPKTFSSAAQPSSASSSSSISPTPASRPHYPTGLVTVLGGTHVQGGATTIHETKVIGTYIDGKYAQILQSTSRIIHASSATTAPPPKSSSASTRPPEIKPTAAFRAPEATPAARLLDRKKAPPSRSQQQASRRTAQTRLAFNQDRSRNQRKESTHALLQTSFETSETTTGRAASRRSTQSLRTFKASRFRSSHDHPSDLDENTIVVTRSRLHRGGTRLRYVPARNTQTVRLNRFKVRLTARPESHYQSVLPEDKAPEPGHDSEDEDVDPLISVDPARVHYHQTTITSLVTLHAGQRKSVRTLTIKTSVPQTLEPSELVSNGILEGSEAPDAITATPLPEETPPLVVSRVYSTTEHTWRTSLVPVFDGLGTTTHTVTESFLIRKIVTAYTTMPPGDLLVLGDHNATLADVDSEQYFQTLLQGVPPLPAPTPSNGANTPLQSSSPVLQPSSLEASYLALPSNGNLPVQLANPLISLGQAFQNNPLAAVYLGLQQLNQQITLYSTVTHTTVYTTTDTVYNTKVFNVYDGRRTRARTLSESLSTTERTLTSYSTTVVPYINTQALQLQQLQQQQLQQLIATNLQPRYSTVTSTYTTVTAATSYSSKVYTLIYNAFSTRYRTVTSSSEYRTTLTLTSTSSFQIQPTTAPPLLPQIAPAQLLTV